MSLEGILVLLGIVVVWLVLIKVLPNLGIHG